jgi:hypothetical protein
VGLLSFRKRKIEGNAKPLLEEGESIQRMVMTQTGESAAETGASAGAGTASGRARVHALAATERNLYVFYIPVLTGIGGVAAKVPLSSANLHADGKRKLILGGVTYHVLFFAGRDARALLEYVEQHR